MMERNPPSNQEALAALREQMNAAVQAFATDKHPVGELLSLMVTDVERAMQEPLEIIPVCHHSPSSALHVAKRLHDKPPKVIFMELCEDLRGSLEGLRDCRLPVALQAFAQTADAFPKGWSPLSVVAPVSEFSAEFQAIAYALEHPETELVFVDRAVDFVFQWMPQKEGELERHLVKEEEHDQATPTAPGEEESSDVPDHGAAIGLQMGNVEPTFDAFLSFLLKNARVRHFSEWWDQYVEQAVLAADYATYRYVLSLVGSLLRRLGRKAEDHENDKRRERYMWTRIKEHLQKTGTAPSDAIYLCGAVHAVSDVEEFGTKTDAVWSIPARTSTKWLYGLIPSSYIAIEHQFQHPPGTIALAENTWDKGISALGIKSWKLNKNKPSVAAAATATASAVPAKSSKSKAAKVVSPPASSPSPSASPVAHPASALADSARVLGFFTKPPLLHSADEEQLLRWSVDIVALARDNGYLTSTADAIAIYQTSLLLANLRNRQHPSPYDFEDAAITCLEKDRQVKKRNIPKLCQMLLGGNRTGRVGYSALPPLAQDVYARLKPLGINLDASTIQRALIDFKKDPHLLACSDLLWMLHYLTAGHPVLRPIMGERKLGHIPVQESWDVSIGKYQESIIRLGYEGVSVEFVVEKRLKAECFGPTAKTVTALKAAEDSILFLKSERLTEELGSRAVDLLRNEMSAQDAPKVVERIRHLVHYYRATPGGLPSWLKDFVATGYSHYSMLLPRGFEDRGTRPSEVAGMLCFVFDFEPQALALGCQRSQLDIAIKQAGPVTTDPAKIGLLWASELLLKLRDIDSIRAFLDQTLDNPLMLPVFPEYVSGFLLALSFAPVIGRVVVELLSKAFARLPEEILYPWLPGLLMSLRPYAEDLLPRLLKDVNGLFPKDLKSLSKWQAPWDKKQSESPAAANSPGSGTTSTPSAGAVLSAEEQAVVDLLVAAPTTANCLAALLS